MYLQLGMEHITDWQGYDHILFIATLISAYQWKDAWKVLKLVTAFTLGHSFSLALSVMGYIHFSTSLIEWLIPFTIALVSLVNWFQKGWLVKFYFKIEYTITVLFGLIHGMGFSVLLSSLLGQSNSLFLPLLSFNIGLEIGQIMIVIVFLSLASVLSLTSSLSIKKWQKAIALICGIFSVYLMYVRW